MSPKHGSKTGETNKGGTKKDHIIDFNQVRAQKLEEKRRKTERVIFKNLLSVYSVVGASQLLPIEMVDVSEEGCAFQVPFNPDNTWPTQTDDIPLRLYFSQDTYLEIHVKVAHSRPAIEEGRRYTRFGCAVDKTLAAYPAYVQFVRFLKLYAEHAHKDLGDVTLFYL